MSGSSRVSAAAAEQHLTPSNGGAAASVMCPKTGSEKSTDATVTPARSAQCSQPIGAGCPLLDGPRPQLLLTGPATEGSPVLFELAGSLCRYPKDVLTEVTRP